MGLTDIIIPFFGDRKDLDVCKEAIKKHCINYEIIVIDNNPPNKNKGFTLAINEGIAKGTSPYIWLLNQDAQVLNGAQEALIKRLESDANIGMVGSMQLDPKNPDRIAFGGTNPCSCFPAGRHNGGLVSMGHCQIPARQTWLNGASVMLKRSVYDVVGPLDNNLFLLYSDSDYSFMVREAGYSCYYEPRSRVLHTLGKASKASGEWQKKDMIAFMKKWGINALPNGQFQYSRRFQNLDTFP